MIGIRVVLLRRIAALQNDAQNRSLTDAEREQIDQELQETQRQLDECALPEDIEEQLIDRGLW